MRGSLRHLRSRAEKMRWVAGEQVRVISQPGTHRRELCLDLS